MKKIIQKLINIFLLSLISFLHLGCASQITAQNQKKLLFTTFNFNPQTLKQNINKFNYENINKFNLDPQKLSQAISKAQTKNYDENEPFLETSKIPKEEVHNAIKRQLNISDLKNTYHGYTCIPKNFPKETYFDVYHIVLNKIEKWNRYFIDKNGDLFVVKENQLIKQDGILSVFMFTYKTCPCQTVLVSEDKQIYVATHFIPKPITASCNGKSASVELVDFTIQLYSIKLKGFDPGETITFISVSEGERITGEIQVPQSNDQLYVLVSPAVIGKSGGYCILTFKSASLPKDLRLFFPWGSKILEDDPDFQNLKQGIL